MALGLMLAPIGASAETANLSGLFPAAARDMVTVRRLGLGGFEGRDGGQLSHALENALGSAEVDGRPYFALAVDNWNGPSPSVDAVLSGSTSGGVEENDVKRTEQRCVEEKDGKCIRRADVAIICRSRVVSVTGNVRVARPGDGSILYSGSKSRREEVSWCPSRRETPPRAIEDMANGMIGSIAQEVRGEIAPSQQSYSVRFLEDRGGMTKEAGGQFKAIVKQSQRDLRGACAAWGALEPSAPGHPSIVFNLALCTEAAGDYRGALARYQAAQQNNPRKARDYADDVDRVARLIQGEADDALRNRRR